MQSTTRVALDAMGGDNAPAEVVKGAVDAVNKRNDISCRTEGTGREGAFFVYIS